MQGDITPAPGYLFCIPYYQKDSPFKAAKETEGDDQKSRILAVGEAVVDTNGTIRISPAKVGEIIIHANSNKTFEIDFEKYRMVHFTEVHGILEVKDES